MADDPELVGLRRDAEGPVAFDAADASVPLDAGTGEAVAADVSVGGDADEDVGGDADVSVGGDPDGGDDGETAVNPVCGMDVTVGQAAATVEFGGETYHFCGQGCADAFGDDPERFVDAEVAANGWMEKTV